MTTTATTATGVRLINDRATGTWITRDGYTIKRDTTDRALWAITAPQGRLGTTLTLAAARDRIAAHRNR